jgi:predicted enzyme related to lactoylglutathione lyase
MKIDRHAPGSFCWFELATTDQPAAKQFYTSLFGWEVADFPMGPSETYTIFRIDGRDAAAAYTMRPEQRAEGTPSNWMLYVRVDDADAAAARALALGATTMGPAFDVGENGRMAVVRDPAGAHFCVWQPKTTEGTGVVEEPGTVVWADLSTPDQDSAGRFYADLFGWKIVGGKNELAAKPGSYHHIVNGEDFIGGIPPATYRDPRTPPHWLLYFAVPSCEAAIARATSLGAHLLHGPMTIESVRSFAVLSDPQGAIFGIVDAQRS